MIRKLGIFVVLWVIVGFITAPLKSSDETDEEVITSSVFVPDHSYELVADRLSCMYSSIPLNFNERVYAFVNYFTDIDREYTEMVLSRVHLYFPIFEKYLKKYGLPDELKYLAIVESGLNPRAVSRAGAAGLWQFMPTTGRYFKLHQDWYIDERLDPEKSTEAACKYMKQLYGIFNDWELALAAYNAGPGNVRKAIRRSGYKKKFWEIYRYLPRETRGYLPQFVAMVYVINHAPEHNLFADPEYHPYSETVVVNNFLNLNTLAEQLNLCLEDLVKINPAIKRNALPKNISNYPLQIPADKMGYLKDNREAIFELAANTGQAEIEYQARNSVGSTWGREKLVHRVRSGEVLGLIAQRYRVRVSDIRKWNGLRGNMIRVGQRLNIWVYPGTKIQSSQRLAKVTPPQLKVLPTGVRTYQVQPGDTLWDISRMYDDLSVEKIKKLNNLKTNKIKPGQTLVIG